MDTTTLNELKAEMYETTQSDERRAFAVRMYGLNCVFAKKAEAKEFKRLYDVATKHIFWPQ